MAGTVQLITAFSTYPDPLVTSLRHQTSVVAAPPGGAPGTQTGGPAAEVQQQQDQENCFPTGITFTPQGDYVIADHANGCLKMWSYNNQYKCSFGSGCLASVWDVTSTKSGKIAATDPIAGNVKVFSKKCKFLAEGQGGMHLTDPHGIAYEPHSARLAVTDKALSCAFVHDKHGKVLDVISSVERSPGSEYEGDGGTTAGYGTTKYRSSGTVYTPYSERLAGTVASLDTAGTGFSGSHSYHSNAPPMLYPSYVCYSQQRDLLSSPAGPSHPPGRVLYVSDTQQHCVYAYYVSGSGILSPEGESSGILWTYGREGVDDYELQNPAGVCVDAAGNILIADAGNCRIHCLDPQGEFLDYVLTWEDGLAEPQALAFCPVDGTLVLTEGTSGLLKKYSYDCEKYRVHEVQA